MAFGRGVNAVGLVEFGYAAHAFQQEGDQGHAGRARYFREDGSEANAVALAQIGGRLHARQEDFDFRIAGPGVANDGQQVVAQGIDFLATKSVVGSQFEHQHANRHAQQPFETPEAPRAGVPAEARVDHAERQPGIVDARLHLRGECVPVRVLESVALGEARAEKENDREAGVRRGFQGGQAGVCRGRCGDGGARGRNFPIR